MEPASLSVEQEKVLAWLPILPATISIISSALLIRLMARARFRTPYRRILCCLSTFDILRTVRFVGNSFLMPQQSSRRLYAMGNSMTCKALGAMTQLSLPVNGYYLCLSLYFLLRIRFEMSDRTFSKYIEPWMHAIVLLYAVVTAAVGLWLELFREVSFGNGCWIAPNIELGCDHVCAVRLQWLFYGGLFFAVFPILLINNAILSRHVIQTTKRGRKFDFELKQQQQQRRQQRLLELQRKQSNDSLSDLKSKDRPPLKRTVDSCSSLGVTTAEATTTTTKRKKANNSKYNSIREVLVQALLYVAVYYSTFMWTLIIRLMGMAGFGSHQESQFFSIFVLRSIFHPLMGLGNLFVYVRPRYLQYRQRFSKQQSKATARTANAGAGSSLHTLTTPKQQQQPASRTQALIAVVWGAYGNTDPSNRSHTGNTRRSGDRRHTPSTSRRQLPEQQQQQQRATERGSGSFRCFKALSNRVSAPSVGPSNQNDHPAQRQLCGSKKSDARMSRFLDRSFSFRSATNDCEGGGGSRFPFASILGRGGSTTFSERGMDSICSARFAAPSSSNLFSVANNNSSHLFAVAAATAQNNSSHFSAAAAPSPTNNSHISIALKNSSSSRSKMNNYNKKKTMIGFCSSIEEGKGAEAEERVLPFVRSCDTLDNPLNHQSTKSSVRDSLLSREGGGGGTEDSNENDIEKEDTGRNDSCNNTDTPLPNSSLPYSISSTTMATTTMQLAHNQRPRSTELSSFSSLPPASPATGGVSHFVVEDPEIASENNNKNSEDDDVGGERVIICSKELQQHQNQEQIRHDVNESEIAEARRRVGSDSSCNNIISDDDDDASFVFLQRPSCQNEGFSIENDTQPGTRSDDHDNIGYDDNEQKEEVYNHCGVQDFTTEYEHSFRSRNSMSQYSNDENKSELENVEIEEVDVEQVDSEVEAEDDDSISDAEDLLLGEYDPEVWEEDDDDDEEEEEDDDRIESLERGMDGTTPPTKSSSNGDGTDDRGYGGGVGGGCDGAECGDGYDNIVASLTRFWSDGNDDKETTIEFITESSEELMGTETNV